MYLKVVTQRVFITISQSFYWNAYHIKSGIIWFYPYSSLGVVFVQYIIQPTVTLEGLADSTALSPSIMMSP